MLNEYDIGRHRFCELKHFCMQYKDWRETYSRIKDNGLQNSRDERDITGNTAAIKTDYEHAIELIETTARATSLVYADYILRSVTEDVSYSYLKNEGLRCDKDTFDALRGRFFYLLSLRKGV